MLAIMSKLLGRKSPARFRSLERRSFVPDQPELEARQLLSTVSGTHAAAQVARPAQVSSAQFVQNVFHSLLDRAATSREQAAWVNRLNHGLSRAQFVQMVNNSPERSQILDEVLIAARSSALASQSTSGTVSRQAVPLTSSGISMTDLGSTSSAVTTALSVFLMTPSSFTIATNTPLAVPTSFATNTFFVPTVPTVPSSFLPNVVPSSFHQNIVPSSFHQNIVPSSFHQNIVPSSFGQNIVPSSFLPGLVPSSFLPGLVPSSFLPGLVPSSFLPSLVPSSFLQ
jgi:hypothetical protein